MSTILSRATMPLANVTMRVSPSSFVSVTKPRERRVWIAPTSRNAAQTSSGEASICISLWIEAIEISSFLGEANRLDIVAVGIDQKSGVVALAVIRPRAGAAVVSAAGLQPRRIKAIDAGAVLGAKRDMRAGVIFLASAR